MQENKPFRLSPLDPPIVPEECGVEYAVLHPPTARLPWRFQNIAMLPTDHESASALTGPHLIPP